MAFERAFARCFRALDWLEPPRPYGVAGRNRRSDRADLRLFPTVCRHDTAYCVRFKLNFRCIADYRGLSAWLPRLLEVPCVTDTQVATTLFNMR